MNKPDQIETAIEYIRLKKEAEKRKAMSLRIRAAKLRKKQMADAGPK